jgi:hypothetical protein
VRRLGDGAVAHDAVEGVAVRIEPGFREFVAEIDEVMILERKRLVVQRRPDASTICCISFLPPARDQTRKVRLCSAPSSVPVLQSRITLWPRVMKGYGALCGASS